MPQWLNCHSNKTIVQTYLNRGGSIGSLCASTMRITLCLAPELYAAPCSLGVYLHARDKIPSSQTITEQ